MGAGAEPHARWGQLYGLGGFYSDGEQLERTVERGRSNRF